MAELASLQVRFINHLDPVMKLVADISALGVLADDVPPLPDRLHVSSVVAPSGSFDCTAVLLPSRELCEWLGAFSEAAAKRLSKRTVAA